MSFVFHSVQQSTGSEECWHAGRENECDFGFVGEGGICVPFVDPGAGPGACGAGGQPVCTGDQLVGALLSFVLTLV